MITVNCPSCQHTFDPTNNGRKGAAALAGAAAGAYIGSGVGLALGPLGAIAGTVPGALLGAAAGWLGLSKVATCPCCKHTFVF